MALIAVVHQISRKSGIRGKKIKKKINFHKMFV